ncbi:MoxR family ATPase [Candidatus Woesearchaeota archaeon]|nr:MoxR family ATPase [Candidatus Woesearchaeota archaeon]
MGSIKAITVPIKRDNSYENKFVDIWGVLPRIRVAIDIGYNVILRGPTGTGKTFLVKELANEYNKTLLVLNMTAGAGVEEVKGRYVVQPGEDGKTQVVWVDGILVTAMKKGWWIVVEEANFMPEELASVFYSVMDDRRNIILDEHENESIVAHPEFRMFMTANWGYKGTVIPNDAIRNRLDFYADLTYLNEKEEGKLIARETEIRDDVAKLIAKFASKQRKIKSRHQPDISTRILIRWANLIKAGLTPLEAGEHTIVSLLFHEETEKDKIREALSFEFEALEEELKKKPSSTSSTSTSGSSKKRAGTIKDGDLIKTSRHSKEYYGIVRRITTSKEGQKYWCMWNEDMDDAIDGTPSPELPMEIPALHKNVELVKTKEELK